MHQCSSDLSADVASRQECQNYYGEQKWFAGHRNGASGLSNPDTDDINSKSPCPRNKLHMIAHYHPSIQECRLLDPESDRFQLELQNR